MHRCGEFILFYSKNDKTFTKNHQNFFFFHFLENILQKWILINTFNKAQAHGLRFYPTQKALYDKHFQFTILYPNLPTHPCAPQIIQCRIVLFYIYTITWSPPCFALPLIIIFFLLLMFPYDFPKFIIIYINLKFNLILTSVNLVHNAPVD